AGACAIGLEVHGQPLLVQPLRIDARSLRDECAALQAAAADREPECRAQALRRLAPLRAPASAIPPPSGGTVQDAALVTGAKETFDTSAPAPAPAPALAPARPGLRHHFENWERLILQGWAMDADAGGEVFELECNGRAVECLVVRTNRVDVSKALQV